MGIFNCERKNIVTSEEWNKSLNRTGRIAPFVDPSTKIVTNKEWNKAPFFKFKK